MFRIYAIIIILGLLGGAYWEYTNMQKRMDTLRENNAKLEMVAKQNQQVIDEMQAFAEQQAELNMQLNKQLMEASKYKDELLSKLRKHDLALLSLKKPGLVEKRINNATKKVFDEIESLTGINNTN